MGFEPTGLGHTIFSERYAHDLGDRRETWDEACQRLALSTSQAESNGKQEAYRQRFHSQLVDGLFMPGGRHWYGAGRKVQQLNNCYVVDVEDSMTGQGWGKLMHDVAVISSRGGGVGINFSKVRPRGYPIGGMGGTATGAVSLMRIINAIGDEIKDGGGRRAALMFCLDVDHPDVLEFLDAKLEVGDIANANISVVLPPHLDASAFRSLVESGGNLQLRWGGLPDREGRTIPARQLWDRLVENAWLNGEPGVLNRAMAEHWNSISYCSELVAVNPCGEQYLPAYGNCCLGSIVLPQFVRNGAVDWEMLGESVQLAVRYLDDTIDIADLPLPETKERALAERRIGLGYMGVHSAMLDCGIRYSSPEALEFVDEVYAFLKNAAYDASMVLAIEKGPFPLFDQRFLDAPFIRGLKPGIRRSIREHGVRNCCLLTQAPTGTTSMPHGVTGGIEPTFSPVYIRRRRAVDGKQRERIEETLVVSSEYIDHPDLVEGAYDVPPAQHLAIQAAAQRHVDNAISKTVNIPRDMPRDAFGSLWLNHLDLLKGTTFYREGSRETADSFEPMRHVPVADMEATVAEWKAAGRDVEYELPDVLDCASGTCEVPWAQAATA